MFSTYGYLSCLDRRGPLPLRSLLMLSLICFLPGALLTTAGVALGFVHIKPNAVIYAWPFKDSPALGLGVGLVDVTILTPLAETGLVWLTIRVIHIAHIPMPVIPLVSALLWGLLHARGGNWASFISAWPFYCFTRLLLHVDKQSLDRACLFVAGVHALHNVAGVILGFLLAENS